MVSLKRTGNFLKDQKILVDHGLYIPVRGVRLNKGELERIFKDHNDREKEKISDLLKKSPITADPVRAAIEPELVIPTVNLTIYGLEYDQDGYDKDDSDDLVIDGSIIEEDEEDEEEDPVIFLPGSVDPVDPVDTVESQADKDRILQAAETKMILKKIKQFKDTIELLGENNPASKAVKLEIDLLIEQLPKAEKTPAEKAAEILQKDYPDLARDLLAQFAAKQPRTKTRKVGTSKNGTAQVTRLDDLPEKLRRYKAVYDGMQKLILLNRTKSYASKVLAEEWGTSPGGAIRMFTAYSLYDRYPVLKNAVNLGTYSLSALGKDGTEVSRSQLISSKIGSPITVELE